MCSVQSEIYVVQYRIIFHNIIFRAILPYKVEKKCFFFSLNYSIIIGIILTYCIHINLVRIIFVFVEIKYSITRLVRSNCWYTFFLKASYTYSSNSRTVECLVIVIVQRCRHKNNKSKMMLPLRRQ